jgi:hypothetical protein
LFNPDRDVGGFQAKCDRRLVLLRFSRGRL